MVDAADVVTMTPGIGVLLKGMERVERVMARAIERVAKVEKVAREADGLLLAKDTVPDHLAVEALPSKTNAMHLIWLPVPNR